MNIYYTKAPYFILAKGSPHEGGNMIIKPMVKTICWSLLLLLLLLLRPSITTTTTITITTTTVEFKQHLLYKSPIGYSRKGVPPMGGGNMINKYVANKVYGHYYYSCYYDYYHVHYYYYFFFFAFFSLFSFFSFCSIVPW